MRNLFSALMIAAAAVVMAIDSQPEKTIDLPTDAVASLAPAALFPEACDCAPCRCDVCKCEPLTVGAPPDVLQLVNLAGGTLTTELSTAATPPPGLVITEPRRNTPPPGLVIPISKPATATQTNQPTAGHWEARSVGLRGRRSQRVWIPHNAPAASHSPAAASYFGSGAACSGGACRSCR